MISIVCQLQKWFQSQCNGDWEHGEGIRIATLDNPGWAVDIDIRDTTFADRPMDDVEIDRSDSDWLHCKMCDGKYSIRCGVQNLEEGISRFLDWAK